MCTTHDNSAPWNPSLYIQGVPPPPPPPQKKKWPPSNSAVQRVQGVKIKFEGTFEKLVKHRGLHIFLLCEFLIFFEHIAFKETFSNIELHPLLNSQRRLETILTTIFNAIYCCHKKIDTCNMASADDFWRSICCRNVLHNFEQTSNFLVVVRSCINKCTLTSNYSNFFSLFIFNNSYFFFYCI